MTEIIQQIYEFGRDITPILAVIHFGEDWKIITSFSEQTLLYQLWQFEAATSENPSHFGRLSDPTETLNNHKIKKILKLTNPIYQC